MLEKLKNISYYTIIMKRILPIYLKGLANLQSLVRQFSTTESVHLLTIFC